MGCEVAFSSLEFLLMLCQIIDLCFPWSGLISLTKFSILGLWLRFVVWS